MLKLTQRRFQYAVLTFLLVFLTLIIFTWTLLPHYSQSNHRNIHKRFKNQKHVAKRILFWSTMYGGHVGADTSTYNCGSGFVCEVTGDKSLLEQSHALIFHGWESDMETYRKYGKGRVQILPKNLPPIRRDDQFWVYFSLEAPVRVSTAFEAYHDLFNWTMNYRADSDIYVPYGRVIQLTPENKILYKEVIQTRQIQAKNDTIRKDKLAAWIVSNCGDSPSKRNELVAELSKYIPVDTYGKCGTLKCGNDFPQNCHQKIGHLYKFYLAFENSLCQDYVSEKFFRALEANMVPVVYGNANYDLVAPKGSYINYNSFASAKALASYLLFLHGNRDEYLKYFEWKKDYILLPGHGYNPYANWCSLCWKLHTNSGNKKSVGSLRDWLFTNYGRYPVCVDPPKKF